MKTVTRHVVSHLISRRRIIATISAGTSVAYLRFPGGAAQFSYKLGLAEDPQHQDTLAMRDLADKLNRASGGQLEISVYPNYQLGSDSSMLLQTRQGALEFQVIADLNLAQLVPIAGVSAIPFAFRSYDQATRAMNGALGSYIVDTIRKAGFYVFAGCFCSGFRQLSNRVRPIVNPDDLKGIKIRVPPSPVAVATFKALGAEVGALSMEQVYTAVQTHLFDGVELTLETFTSRKFFEVLKYMTLWNYQYTANHVLANIDAMQRLPKSLRDTVEAQFHSQLAGLDRDNIRINERLSDQLKDQGMTVSQANIPAFRTAIRAAGLYPQWRQQYGSDVWNLMERAVGTLA